MSIVVRQISTPRLPSGPQRGSTIHRQISGAAIIALIATPMLLFSIRPAVATQSATVASSVISNPAANPQASTGQTQFKQPLLFEPNAGQTDPSVRFVAHAQGSALFFTPTGVTLSLADQTSTLDPSAVTAFASNIVRLEFVGANSATLFSDGPELPGKVNYIVGNDPAKWHTNVQTYSAINYSGLYKGVTLNYRGVQGHLKGTYTVAAGADPSQIRWRYAGASAAQVDSAGNLLISGLGGQGTSNTLMTEHAPVAWQQVGNNKMPVEARYLVAADGTATFALGKYNKAEPLVIDPTLDFSTFLGGTGQVRQTALLPTRPATFM